MMMLTIPSGKVAQVAFAFITPRTSPNAVIINLIAGAIAEAGACQAADLMCDLKAGHLLRASPGDLLKGQLIGSLFGAFVATLSYALLTSFYPTKPGTKTPFEMPSAHMWFEAAKLSLGQGLSERALEVSIGTAIVCLVLASAKITFAKVWWVDTFFPSGVSLALGQ
jgi:uncharacterized oligopeptide transporter (OPT) family protein